eukprot:CAMPEP_0118863368 /NCGR_PEP_ID=MMETSP1163-20130328/8263_1 /TAXON_ID=124430 /ORGANISM="Phaeomonas parva, Strain CCMP2877" /LENGTH=686 /DNA_ID=CAMNT_0006797367 /DNA_START=30 /DNA_END=2087 /DNA_ORIENTATION=-
MAALTEEEIIAQLELQADGTSIFEDDWKALYRNPSQVPAYDEHGGDFRWLRPAQYLRRPEYFHWVGDRVQLQAGRLDDAWFLGALAAVASHPAGLVEALFGSNADDFKRYGVYTCRFYLNGEWREVICDTKLPVEDKPVNPFADMEAAEEGPGMAPIYGHSAHPEELWVSFIEKAYAKLNGSYENLNEGSPAEALVDLTGGSCVELDMASDTAKQLAGSGELWDLLLAHINDGGILCGQVEPPNASEGKEELADADPALVEPDPVTGLLPNRLYTVIALREVPGAPPLVLVRNPWGIEGDWEGDWGEGSAMWEDYPDVEEALASGNTTPWTTDGENNGLFWMPFVDFCENFTTLFVCRIFDDDAYYQYCVEGDWAGKTAAGPPRRPLRAAQGVLDFNAVYPQGKKNEKKGAGGISPKASDGAAAPSANGQKEAYAESLARHFEGSKMLCEDGEPFWFNNPQFRVVTGSRPCRIYVSLQQRQGRRAGAAKRVGPSIGFHLLKIDSEAEGVLGRIWELKDVIADSAQDLMASKEALGEVVCQDVTLEPDTKYVIVPHAGQKNREGRFCLRVFCRSALDIASVTETSSVYLPGAWERTPEQDSCGGPVLVVEEESKPANKAGMPLTPPPTEPEEEGAQPETVTLLKMKQNPKWCQNPQYWVRFAETSDDPLAQSATIKFVVRRTDRRQE